MSSIRRPPLQARDTRQQNIQSPPKQPNFYATKLGMDVVKRSQGLHDTKTPVARSAKTAMYHSTESDSDYSMSTSLTSSPIRSRVQHARSVSATVTKSKMSLDTPTNKPPTARSKTAIGNYRPVSKPISETTTPLQRRLNDQVASIPEKTSAAAMKPSISNLVSGYKSSTFSGKENVPLGNFATIRSSLRDDGHALTSLEVVENDDEFVDDYDDVCEHTNEPRSSTPVNTGAPDIHVDYECEMSFINPKSLNNFAHDILHGSASTGESVLQGSGEYYQVAGY
ncbi:hypothetical protein V1514DRAFT_72793 [Lipomyces japonicus]|uniref:uncharacterized protein n=1 Tax=Lipomyces japonicus TaxID=56871 RepID=UPI0034CD0439